MLPFILVFVKRFTNYCKSTISILNGRKKRYNQPFFSLWWWLNPWCKAAVTLTVWHSIAHPHTQGGLTATNVPTAPPSSVLALPYRCNTQHHTLWVESIKRIGKWVREALRCCYSPPEAQSYHCQNSITITMGISAESSHFFGFTKTPPCIVLIITILPSMLKSGKVGNFCSFNFLNHSYQLSICKTKHSFLSGK